MLLIVLIVITVITVSAVITVIISRRKVDYSLSDKWLVDQFNNCNVIVFGKKGTGKDLLFSHVISLCGERHYSNIRYNKQTELRDVRELAIGDITWRNLIEGDFERIDPTFDRYVNFYISDAGIYFPSQYDKELDKIYPSMPIFYALSRQLYNMNIHCNVQNLKRIWLKLREQADCYIRTIKTVDRGDYLVVTAICYDKYESALANLLPGVKRSTDGEVVKRKFRIMKTDIHYDTYYFRSVLLNVNEKNRLEGLYYEN